MSDGSDQNQDAGDQQTQQHAPAMPDGLPESFWDAEAGAVKTDDLIGGYKELHTFKSEYDARLANRPETPDAYEFRLPEGVQLPEEMKDVDLNVIKDTPLAKAVSKAVYDAGGDQAAFDGILKEFLNDEIAYQQAQMQAMENFYKEEKGKLGQNADARIEGAEKFLQARLPEDQFEAIKSVATTAKGVEALETLIAALQDAPVQTGGNSGGDAVTQESLDSLQADPRYWRDKDPAIVKQVQDGYAKLYPGKQQRVI